MSLPVFKSDHDKLNASLATPVKSSALSAALGVNAIVTCDCGEPYFKVGLAYNPTNGNNFIRLLECIRCGHQMPATHQSDAQLAPKVGLGQ